MLEERLGNNFVILLLDFNLVVESYHLLVADVPAQFFQNLFQLGILLERLFADHGGCMVAGEIPTIIIQHHNRLLLEPSGRGEYGNDIDTLTLYRFIPKTEIDFL